MKNYWPAIARRVALAALIVAAALAGATGPLSAEQPPSVVAAKPGPFAVEVATYDWVDKTRDREVPVKIYFPKTGRGPFPIIIFSHGLGGSRDGYEYLGRHWASHGYVSVHLQHKGSDTAVWKGQARPLEAMRNSLTDPRNADQPPTGRPFRHRPRWKRSVGNRDRSAAGWTCRASAWQAIRSAHGRRWR